MAFRGEQHGIGIQNFPNNPHSKLPLDVMFYSVFIIGEGYARKGSPFYLYDIDVNVPKCPIIERNVPLTQELIRKYDSEIDKINGNCFEGVVIQHKAGSFKVINKDYDSRK